MKKRRFSVEQMIGVLKQAEVGVPVAEVIRKAGISEQTCFEGIAEFSIYVRRDFRGRGVETLAMRELITRLQKCGFWKPMS